MNACANLHATAGMILLCLIAKLEPSPAPDAPGLLYIVNTTSDTVVIGACQNGDPGCSLRGAIQTANSHVGADGILIDLAPGSIINLTQALPNIAESVSISGPGADQLTVRRNTGGDYRIFNITASGAVTLSGMTIREGRQENGDGGGILHSNSSGSLNLTNCTVTANRVFVSQDGSANGGGVAHSGALTATNCVFSDNDASGSFTVGGGIYSSASSALTLTNCTINSNDAARGGGAFCFVTGSATLRNCKIADNSAVGINGNSASGGGLYISQGTLNIINSSLNNNQATAFSVGATKEGGGIFNSNGTVNITNSTLNNNTAADGGGIYNTATLKVTNSTLSGNNAFAGGGIYSEGTAIVTNCTITGNRGKDGGGILVVSGGMNVKSNIIALNDVNADSDVKGAFNSSGFNFVGVAEGSSGFNQPTDQTGSAAANQRLDPRFDPNGLQNNGGPTQTIALLPTSPAIDKGTSNGLTGNLTTDQRGSGFPRASNYSNIADASGGDATDIGAFEGTALRMTSITRLPNGHVLLLGIGRPGAAHAVESTPDLASNFAPLPNSVVGDGTGVLQFEDTPQPGALMQFYRFRFPSP